MGQRHAAVDGSSSVVAVELLDEGVEFRGGRADLEKKGDLDEDDEGSGDTILGREWEVSDWFKMPVGMDSGVNGDGKRSALHCENREDDC